MRRLRTHFEQIPLEVVRKVAGRQASNKKRTPRRDATVERVAQETEPRRNLPRPRMNAGKRV